MKPVISFTPRIRKEDTKDVKERHRARQGTIEGGEEMAARAKGVSKAKRTARRPAVRRSSGNVFADLGFEQEEAEHLRIRSALMATVRQVILERGMTQTEAASLLEVTQPRISDLMRGKMDRFSIDTLVEMLSRAGVRTELKTRRT